MSHPPGKEDRLTDFLSRVDTQQCKCSTKGSILYYLISLPMGQIPILSFPNRDAVLVFGSDSKASKIGHQYCVCFLHHEQELLYTLPLIEFKVLFCVGFVGNQIAVNSYGERLAVLSLSIMNMLLVSVGPSFQTTGSLASKMRWKSTA